MLKWHRRTALDIAAASVANNGDLLIGLTGPSIDAVELLDAEGNTLWKRYFLDLFGVHQSEDGSIIVVDRYHRGERALEAYSREGTILWRYSSSELGTVKALSMEKGGSFIALYAVRYTDEGEVHKLITLRRDGRIMQDITVWSKKQHDRGGVARPEFPIISSAGTITALAFYDPHSGSTYLSVYSLDGRKVYSLKLQGIPEKLYAAGHNVILLGLSRDQHPETLIIRKGKVLAKWKKPILSVSMTYSGDRIAVCDYEGVHVYNEFGELLWEHPSAGGARCVISDNYYVLASISGDEIQLFSPSGEMMYSYRVVNPGNLLISSNGRFFAVLSLNEILFFEVLARSKSFEVSPSLQTQTLELNIERRISRIVKKIDELLIR